MSKRDLSVAKISELEGLALPPEWKCVRAEIRFERQGVLGEWATVVYDGRNKTFYVETNKAIVYQNDTPALEEAISLMRQVNRIIESPVTDTTSQ